MYTGFYSSTNGGGGVFSKEMNGLEVHVQGNKPDSHEQLCMCFLMQNLDICKADMKVEQGVWEAGGDSKE